MKSDGRPWHIRAMDISRDEAGIATAPTTAVKQLRSYYHRMQNTTVRTAPCSSMSLPVHPLLSLCRLVVKPHRGPLVYVVISPPE